MMLTARQYTVWQWLPGAVRRRGGCDPGDLLPIAVPCSHFTDENHQKRWLLQVAANLCRNQLRGFWRKRVTQLEDTIPAIVPEELEALNAVMALPEQYKLPIHLYYYEGYSVTEIAEILKMGKSAVKMRLKRGRELLKMELEGSN